MVVRFGGEYRTFNPVGLSIALRRRATRIVNREGVIPVTQTLDGGIGNVVRLVGSAGAEVDQNSHYSPHHQTRDEIAGSEGVIEMLCLGFTSFLLHFHDERSVPGVKSNGATRADSVSVNINVRLRMILNDNCPTILTAPKHYAATAECEGE